MLDLKTTKKNIFGLNCYSEVPSKQKDSNKREG